MAGAVVRKAATIVRDWIVSIAESLDDLDRLRDLLCRLEAVIANKARVRTAVNKHPSLFQLLENPELLDYIVA